MHELRDATNRRWVRGRLRALPGWHATSRERSVRCEWRFDSPEIAAAFVLAAIRATPDRALIACCTWTGARVAFTLRGRSDRVDEEVLTLAGRISAVNRPELLAAFERAGEAAAATSEGDTR